MSRKFSFLIRNWLLSLGCKHVSRMYYYYTDFRLRELRSLPFTQHRQGMIDCYEDILNLSHVQFSIYENELITNFDNDCFSAVFKSKVSNSRVL